MPVSPRVSVVMPAYNARAFLVRALDSIRNQTYDDLEMIVVNDGSTDDTAQILAAYQQQEPRLRVSHQDNHGLADALNRGCRMARGGYLARMDADDIAYPDRIGAQVDYLDQHPCVAVVGTQARLISGDGQPSAFTSRHPVRSAAVRRLLRRRNVLVHPSVMMRRDAYEQTTGYRRAVAPAEDYDLWLRILERHDIANLPTVLLDYTVHDGQASARLLERQIFGALAAQLAAQDRSRDRLDTIDTVTREDLHQLGASDHRVEQARIEGYAEMANKAWTVGNPSQAFSLLDTAAVGLSPAGVRRLRSERRWLQAKRARAQGRPPACVCRVLLCCVVCPSMFGRVIRAARGLSRTPFGVTPLKRASNSTAVVRGALSDPVGGGDGRPLRVLYVFRRDRAKMLGDYRAGTGPDDMLYGYNRMPTDRYSVDFIEDEESRWTLFRVAWKPVHHWLAGRVRMGFTQPMIYEHLDKLKWADVIIATSDACALPILRWRAKHRLGAAVIVISQGMADRLAGLDQRGSINQRIASLYRYYYQAADRVAVLGMGAVGPTQETLRLSPDRMAYVPFGVDERFWSPGRVVETNSKKPFVLSVGSDPGRDYQTLLQAIRGLGLSAKIVTRLRVRPSGSIEVRSDYSNIQLRGLYRSARFVVTPLHDISQPSGQSATLQAMACGKAVILTRTRGLWDTAVMRHGDNCILVEPGDVMSLQRAVDRLWADPGEAARIGGNARQTVLDHGRSRGLAARMVSLIDEVAGHPHEIKTYHHPSIG